VPAVAAIQEGQALFIMTGRKALVDCNSKLFSKILKPNFKIAFKTTLLEFCIEK